MMVTVEKRSGKTYKKNTTMKIIWKKKNEKKRNSFQKNIAPKELHHTWMMVGMMLNNAKERKEVIASDPLNQIQYPISATSIFSFYPPYPSSFTQTGRWHGVRRQSFSSHGTNGRGSGDGRIHLFLPGNRCSQKERLLFLKDFRDQRNLVEGRKNTDLLQSILSDRNKDCVSDVSKSSR